MQGAWSGARVVALAWVGLPNTSRVAQTGARTQLAAARTLELTTLARTTLPLRTRAIMIIPSPETRRNLAMESEEEAEAPYLCAHCDQPLPTYQRTAATHIRFCKARSRKRAEPGNTVCPARLGQVCVCSETVLQITL